MKAVNIKLSLAENVKTFVNIVNKYPYDVDLRAGRHVVDAKSILGIFSLDLSKPIAMEVMMTHAMTCSRISSPSSSDDICLSKAMMWRAGAWPIRRCSGAYFCVGILFTHGIHIYSAAMRSACRRPHILYRFTPLRHGEIDLHFDSHLWRTAAHTRRRA